MYLLVIQNKIYNELDILDIADPIVIDVGRAGCEHEDLIHSQLYIRNINHPVSIHIVRISRCNRDMDA